MSALRLATGIQSVVGGEIYFIDTENRRAKAYAIDPKNPKPKERKFKFRHIDFREPFGSLDYLAAMEHCVKEGAKVVIVDSMSHEHEGVGGMIDMHDQELERKAGDDFKKQMQQTMSCWIKPKAARRQLINRMLQLDCNFIFCFRAKETSKPVRDGNGKMEVQQLGFMPIAGSEFIYEMTLNCLLLPKSDGVPTWRTDQIGEKMMMKCPDFFFDLFPEEGNVQINEEMGAKMARWAAGDMVPVTPAGKATRDLVAVNNAIITERLRVFGEDVNKTSYQSWLTANFGFGSLKGQSQETAEGVLATLKGMRDFDANPDPSLNGRPSVLPTDDNADTDDPFAGDQPTLAMN